MGRIKKKGTSGEAKNYITRTRAVRKLQISLPDFRRLCIFKGIYPREPRNKKKVAKGTTPSTTFYYTKDIQYLLHEPLLQKFREHKAVGKKISRALGRGEIKDAARLERNLAPRMKLDHIIKERYPTFVDALRDLDDCLSMLFLFANLPSTSHVPAKTIALCQRLTHEFQHYLIVSHSLRKSFLSIKGIYYQATIQGQDILWLVPYRFVQNMGGDIDFRIMGTFVEFYTTLLGFVNYRLYTQIGLVYPPKFNTSSDDRGAELGAFTLEGRAVAGQKQHQYQQKQLEAPKQNGNGVSSTAQAAADALAATANGSQADELQSPKEQEPPGDDDPSADPSSTNPVTTLDTFAPAAPGGDVLAQPDASASSSAAAAIASSLFAPCTVFLSRETPRAPLELLLRAFGCARVGWDASLGEGAFLTDEADSRITHQVVDRPAGPASAAVSPAQVAESGGGNDGPAKTPGQGQRQRVPGRTYVQPQWVWDCVNEGRLLRPDLYAPGAELPPHLSPWGRERLRRGEYDPTVPLAEQEGEGEGVAGGVEEEEEEEVEAEGEEEEEDIAERAEVQSEHAEKSGRDALLDRADGEMAAGEGMAVELASSDDGEDEEGEESGDDEFAGFGSGSDGQSADSADSDDDDEEAALQRTRQRELAAEAAGTSFAAATTAVPSASADAAQADGDEEKRKAAARRKALRRKREEEDEFERRKGMLSRRKRKVLEKMAWGNKVREGEAERLRGKRRRLEGKKGL
ncbi:Pescadillo N-terminus-domain-containing protein [Lineolata rhizophorae]|uniref:Pescadillo homolog n=1 Tax=Lineolata rhizophorae TaxID=578093 RepID=A0A6A6NRM0_9PEZI|nr:Pescadillo N-terminus-domain-containing protein [Lineolata rhizophorae]